LRRPGGSRLRNAWPETGQVRPGRELDAMDSPLIIPLAVFAMVVLLVAIINVMKIRDIETDVRLRLHQEEMEHRRKMQELDQRLAQLKQG
jgi:hypothetical protein